MSLIMLSPIVSGIISHPIPDTRRSDITFVLSFSSGQLAVTTNIRGNVIRLIWMTSKWGGEAAADTIIQQMTELMRAV